MLPRTGERGNGAGVNNLVAFSGALLSRSFVSVRAPFGDGVALFCGYSALKLEGRFTSIRQFALAFRGT